jgi:hypothetical protein
LSPRDRLKSFWNALIEWLVETPCYKLCMFAGGIGGLLILLLSALDRLSLVALLTVMGLFMGTPFHFLVTGYCDSWKRERKEEMGIILESDDNK